MPASIGPDEKWFTITLAVSDDCLIISKSPSPLEVLFISRPAHFSIFDPSFLRFSWLRKYSSDSDAACANFLPKLRLSLISILSRNELNQEFPAIHTTCPDLHESEIEPSDPDFHLSLSVSCRVFCLRNLLRKPRQSSPEEIRNSIKGFV